MWDIYTYRLVTLWFNPLGTPVRFCCEQSIMVGWLHWQNTGHPSLESTKLSIKNPRMQIKRSSIEFHSISQRAILHLINHKIYSIQKHWIKCRSIRQTLIPDDTYPYLVSNNRVLHCIINIAIKCSVIIFLSFSQTATARYFFWSSTNIDKAPFWTLFICLVYLLLFILGCSQIRVDSDKTRYNVTFIIVFYSLSSYIKMASPKWQ